MENVYIILTLMLLGYVAIYFGGRKYLEHFENRFNVDGSPVTDAKMIASKTADYPMQPSQDMYDVSAVYNNQGSKQATKKQLSDAMTRYPLDWSVQGPGSQVFQEGLAQYENQMERNPSTVQPFQDQPTDMLLPDASILEDEERKILQTYKPESSKGLLHYSMHDVTHLLDKIYAKKGLVPVIEKSKQGENVWEIVEVKEKNPKIVWEDGTVDQGSSDPTRQKMTQRGEDVIEVPYTASDMSAGLDPFRQPRNRIRTGGHDIKPNSELDRMFQPTHPIPHWQ